MALCESQCDSPSTLAVTNPALVKRCVKDKSVSLTRVCLWPCSQSTRGGGSFALSRLTVSDGQEDPPGAVQVARVVAREARAQDHITHVMKSPSTLG